MKLPEEVRAVERSLHADEQEKLYEAIVRDCVKVCDEYAKGPIPASTIALYLSNAILARYGLEPK